MLWALIGAVLIVAAAASAGYLIGYCIGWNERGIANRARRAQAAADAYHDTRWRTELLDRHRREAAADREWEEILDGLSHDVELSRLLDGHSLPRADPFYQSPEQAERITRLNESEVFGSLNRPLADTGPQDVIA